MFPSKFFNPGYFAPVYWLRLSSPAPVVVFGNLGGTGNGLSPVVRVRIGRKVM